MVEVPWYQEGWFYAVLAIAVIVLPFIVGGWLAKRLRMNDYAWRIGLVLFSLVAGIVVCVYGWPPRLGIDLSGGVILVYEVDASKAASADLSTVVDDVRKDLSENGGANIKVDANAEGNVEITLPNADPTEIARIEKRVEESESHPAAARSAQYAAWFWNRARCATESKCWCTACGAPASPTWI